MVDLDLTKRQQEIFDFIKQYSAKYGYPPTVRDIGKAVGLASSSTVHAHLANLEKIGLLRRDPSKPRAIELLDRRPKASRASSARTACRSSARSPPASPMLAEENIEEYVDVPAVAGGEDGRVRPPRARRLDEGRRHPRGRLRRRAPAGDRQRRRDRRRPGRRGGDRQALLPRGRPRPPAAREPGDGADPLQARSACSVRWSACSGRCRDAGR